MLQQITFFTITIGIIETILVSAHWVLYKTIVRFFAIENHTVILSLKIILGILSVSFVFASILSFRYYNELVKIFYTLAAGWLGFLYLLLAASFFACTLNYFNLKLSPCYLRHIRISYFDWHLRFGARRRS